MPPSEIRLFPQRASGKEKAAVPPPLSTRSRKGQGRVERWEAGKGSVLEGVQGGAEEKRLRLSYVVTYRRRDVRDLKLELPHRCRLLLGSRCANSQQAWVVTASLALYGQNRLATLYRKLAKSSGVRCLPKRPQALHRPATDCSFCHQKVVESNVA